MRFFISIVLFAAGISCASAQHNLQRQLDSVLTSRKDKFNGVVLVTQRGTVLYQTAQGYSDLEAKKSVKTDDQFIIGSISKQITAVLILREYEKGHLRLDGKLNQYLPELTYSWADSVTIHDLLTHTSGVRENLQPPLVFKPGSRFEYSNTGFNLLGDVVAHTSGKSYLVMAEDLFKECGMKNSFHPASKKHNRLVKGYVEDEQGIINDVTTEERYAVAIAAIAASGGFISTAADLAKWNTSLHGGKLLEDSTYKLMMTAYDNAVRQHPLSGRTVYGYGITVDKTNSLLQLGQTGRVPGYNSINFHFPESGTSMIVFNNIQYSPMDAKECFRYHAGVQHVVRRYLLAGRKQ